MRRFALTLMASLLSCSFAQAFWPEATDSSLEIGVGYRQDHFKFTSVADLTDYSDSYYTGTVFELPPVGVKSKLEWKNINIWQIEAKGKYVTCDNIYLRASGDYGWITSGKNRDRDSLFAGDGDYSSYYGDSFEFADSSSKVKGHVYDVKLAVGYQFHTCDDTFSVSPLVGYSWHGQHFKDHHLRQNNNGFVAYDYTSSFSDYTYDYSSYGYDYSSYDYSYDGEHSHYNTRWNGPFLGFDFDYSICCRWNIFGGYEFHWAQFNAKAKWDLRDDLLDGFRQHSKNAYGQVFDIGVKWDMCDCWTLALRGEFQWWHAHRGHDRAKIAELEVGNVKAKTFLEIPTRNTEWCSSSVMLDLGMVF